MTYLPKAGGSEDDAGELSEDLDVGVWEAVTLLVIVPLLLLVFI